MSGGIRIEDRVIKQVSEKRRKPYQKPGFRFERVFETMALACGKIAPTQKHCGFRRKSS